MELYCGSIFIGLAGTVYENSVGVGRFEGKSGLSALLEVPL